MVIKGERYDGYDQGEYNSNRNAQYVSTFPPLRFKLNIKNTVSGKFFKLLYFLDGYDILRLRANVRLMDATH